MRQYLDVKDKHPDGIVLFRLGDFWPHVVVVAGHSAISDSGDSDPRKDHRMINFVIVRPEAESTRSQDRRHRDDARGFNKFAATDAIGWHSF